MIGVAVVGYGYWGPNLARNFQDAPGAELRAVCDQDEQKLCRARARHPGVQMTGDLDGLLSDPRVEAVVIATPVSTHFPLALAALQAGKHVLVEKPLADSAEKCRQLAETARAKGLTLMVDHTFVYTGAVRKIKELVDRGELGNLYYFDSVRVNLGLFQRDVSVIWDLAVHDLAILESVVPYRPVAVSCTGISHVPGQPANTAYLTLMYEQSFIAHMHVSWLAPVKLRQTLIGGSEKMIVYDDLEPSEKVKLYDKGITVRTDAESIARLLVGYRAGDMWAPTLDGTEALQRMARHFLECIASRNEPTTGAESGLRVVGVMEAAAQSMARRGEPVAVGNAV